MTERILCIIACAVAGAALGVALGHAGARGPQGPPGARGATGSVGKAAQVARLGICWNDTSTYSDIEQQVIINSLEIDPPVVQDGVYTCPNGDSFVSVVPNPATTGVN